MVTSQALSLERLARPVADAGAPAHEAAVIGDLDDEDVAIALRKRPELHRLLFQGLGAADRAPRSEFLRGLADWTARNLVDALPAGQLGAANLSAYAGIVDSLRAEEILNA